MSRRLAAVGVALVLLTLAAAGALGGVFASDTTGSGLKIDAADGPNGDYADLSNDRLRLNLTAGGVSNDAITRLDAVFVITNDRSYEAPVWLTDNSSALRFYDADTGASIESRSNGQNLIAGESLRVGVSVDTRKSTVSEVEATSSFVIETLVKDSTETADGSDPSDAPDTSDTPGGTDVDGGDSNTDTSGGANDPPDDGGTGGRGQPSGGSESSYVVHDTGEGATVDVDEGVATDPFTADLTGDSGESYASGADTDLTGASVDLTFDRERWRIEVTDPTAEPQDAPGVAAGEAVSYFRADAYQAEASAFSRIGVNATVSADADPESVAFYRYTDDGWQRVETNHRGGDRFSAALDGFGEVAVVIDPGGGGNGDGTAGGDGPGTAETPIDGELAEGGDGTATPTDTDGGTESANGTATAADRLQDPLRLDQGLGGPTIVVFGAFSLWLAARGRVGGGGGGGLGGSGGL